MLESTLAEKVALLLRTDSYPEPTSRVELKETHMSCVFLTDREVWKLKKPAHEDFLDFRTVEARRLNCELEVTLNRRLAPDVYRGVIPLFREESGMLRLGGCPGIGWTVTDWLVRMRRLPEARMLDGALLAGKLRGEDVCRLGVRLADFYKNATVIPMGAEEYRQRLESDVNATAIELRKAEYVLPVAEVDLLRSKQLDTLRSRPAMFDERVCKGKVVDAHGDLRPEHICLEQIPVIIDCLEFNASFRMLDPVSELKFLGLECSRLNAAWVGRSLLAIYERETGDRASHPLLNFYRRQHALTRAKIAVWHLKDSAVVERDKWIAKAKDYLRRAS